MKDQINKYQLCLETGSPYRRPAQVLLWILFILPALFLLAQSLDIYFVSHILILILFPAFVWCYLESDKLRDLKLDVAKISFVSTSYFSYLLFLSFVILKVLKSSFTASFLLIEFLYLGLLLVIMMLIIAVLLFKHYRHRSKLLTKQSLQPI